MRQADLAKQLGISKPYVSMLLSGKRKPSKRLAEKLKQVNLIVSNECGNGLKIRLDRASNTITARLQPEVPQCHALLTYDVREDGAQPCPIPVESLC